MKTITRQKLAASIFLLAAFLAKGATFDSGSNGSYGALEVTTNLTLDLPPDGIFHCTTVVIHTGAVLTFRTNLLNTPVFLLAQGDVQVDFGGIIDVSGGPPFGAIPGSPGPGGFPGGFGGSPNDDVPGDGFGPGGGRLGNATANAAFAFSAGANTNTYGNVLLIPLVGGSGSASSSQQAGGSGGGALLVASNTRITVSGRIWAKGGGGSGGAIRLLAPRVDGLGDLDVSAGFYASPGRVRIDTLDRFAWRGFNLTGAGRWTVVAQMTTGLADSRRLDIVEVAGQTIAAGATSGVDINLPVGSDTNQLVKVRASGFTGDVPITVALIPENGRSTRYDSLIPASGSGPATNAVNVIVPIDVVTRVQVWSR